MKEAFTCKVQQISKAPEHIELLGDKTKRPEPAQHVIEFPGGAVEVSRTTDGRYWAHIIVNRDVVVRDADGRVSRIGKVVDSRIARFGSGSPVEDISEADSITQIAVLIETV